MKGLAIAGGGLKCSAQIGALKALEELNIKFDAVAGTSSGSVIASMYALNCTYDEMGGLIKNYYKKFTKFNMSKLFRGATSFLSSGVAKIDGIIDAEKIQNLFKEIAQKDNITKMSDMKTNLSIVSVDTKTAKEVVFTSRMPENINDDYIYMDDVPLDLAIRASAAFPGFFQTVTYGKYNFIDGGTKNNLPTEPLKLAGVDKILALTFELDEYKPKKDLLAILLRTCDIFSDDRMKQSKSLADLCIDISVPGASLLSVDDFDKCCQIGYDAVMSKKEEILKMFS